MNMTIGTLQSRIGDLVAWRSNLLVITRLGAHGGVA